MKFKSEHNMEVVKFELIEIDENDKFPYHLRGYSKLKGKEWIPCDLIHDVNMSWFIRKKVTLIKE